MTYKPAMLREQFTGMPRHFAGGVGTLYVCGTYHLQYAWASNGSKELHHSYHIYQWKRIYSTAMVLRQW